MLSFFNYLLYELCPLSHVMRDIQKQNATFWGLKIKMTTTQLGPMCKGTLNM